MAEASWRLFYESDLQSFWSLIVVPAAFVAYLLGSARARKAAAASADARLLYAYALAFGIATIVDPLCTGPMVEWLDLGTGATSAVMIAFVLLGDFRVFLLVFFLTRPDRRLGRAAAEAALWTLGVPIFAVGANAAVEWLRPEIPGQRLWLIYELCFLALALFLRAQVIPRRAAGSPPALLRCLQRVLAYVAVYYALWATADVLILYGGIDAGWLLRALPNQLYYAFWVPFTYAILAGVLHRPAVSRRSPPGESGAPMTGDPRAPRSGGGASPACPVAG